MFKLLLLLFFFGIIIIPGILDSKTSENISAGTNSYYEMGVSYLLQGDGNRAQEFFQKGIQKGGQFSDKSRLQLIRLLASPDGKNGKSQYNQIRRLLEEVQDPALTEIAWYAAMRALNDSGLHNKALDLALEAQGRFLNTELQDSAAFFAAQLFYDKRDMTAALDQLFKILKRHPGGDGLYLDDAYFLIALVYNYPGEYYDPRRTRNALKIFQQYEMEKNLVFLNSPWRGAVARLLRHFTTQNGK